MKIKFCLNGKETEVKTEPDRRVVDLLREDLGLTGLKECCGSGECGACTILLDGESRLSCLMLAAQLANRSIVTIEGLGSEGPAPDNSLHAVQQAFIEYGAVQCGYCTPGMILAAVDLLRRQPAPSREQIRAGISGNICRCTGYQKIIDAIYAAALARPRGDR